MNVVHKEGEVHAVFDDIRNAEEFAKQYGYAVVSVVHNPPFKRMYRVEFIAGKLWDPSPDIGVDISLGNSDRRTHGQIYSGNPGMWVVYVEAMTSEEAKKVARDILVDALKRIR